MSGPRRRGGRERSLAAEPRPPLAARMPRPLVPAFLLLMFPFIAGCGRSEEKAWQWAATATNTLGMLEIRTDRKLAPTIAAFDAAMQDLEFEKGEAEIKTIEAVLTYRTATTVVTVKLKEFPDYTNIRLRCGVMGEETLSRQILAAVHRRL